MLLRFRLGLAALSIVLVVPACGGSDPEPEPTATPAGPTVGELADRIAAAWPAVETYRSVTTTQGSGVRSKELGAPPSAAPDPRLPTPNSSGQTVTEVIVPDRKRHVIRADGEVQSEFVVVERRVFARGMLAETLPNATPAADGWVVVDPAAVDAGSQAGALIANLARDAGPPYAGLSESERNRTATPMGEETAGDRVCVAYRIADTTQTGDQIEVTLALGPDDLPCFIETRVGETVTITTFAYDVAVEIAPPGA